MAAPLDLHLDDVVRLKRLHPCGGSDWQVTRLGADIGLRCLTCGRRVLLERAVLEKRLKQFVSRAAVAKDGEKGNSTPDSSEAFEGRRVIGRTLFSSPARRSNREA